MDGNYLNQYFKGFECILSEFDVFFSGFGEIVIRDYLDTDPFRLF